MAKAKVRDESELMLKKKTLEAWTMLFFREGRIDFAKCERMLSEIHKLKG